MEVILRYLQQILSTPAIFVGLIAMLGLILKKSDSQSIIKGTIKTILGFIVLGAGAGVVQQSIVPFGDLLYFSPRSKPNILTVTTLLTVVIVILLSLTNHAPKCLQNAKAFKNLPNIARKSKRLSAAKIIISLASITRMNHARKCLWRNVEAVPSRI